MWNQTRNCRLLILAFVVAALPAAATELKPAAVKAFDTYVQVTELRMQEELKNGQFLHVETFEPQARGGLYRRMQEGDVVEEQLRTKQNGKDIEIPDAMIHDWVATMFIPGVRLEEVKSFMQDYDQQWKYYKPDVMRSRLISRNGDDFKIYLRMFKKKIVSVTLNTDHNVHYTQPDASHLISKSWTTRIAEVDNPDTPQEREEPVGDDHGFMWRLNSYWRSEQKDGGVYVQCQSVTLTRNIPWGLSWLGPFINSTSKEFLTNMMRDLRTAVQTRSRGQAAAGRAN
jgi:hypothetical protein